MHAHRMSLATLAVLLFSLLPLRAQATDAHAAVHPRNTEAVDTGNTLVLSAPPRGTLAEETQSYQPIADFLSKVTGKKVVYEHSDNWLTYTSKMTKGKYDIVFDGPHFNGWRMERLQHTPLVKLPEDFVTTEITLDVKH